MAESANVSVSGCARRDVYASIAWQRASTPVAAVTAGGAVIVNEGSTTASAGMIEGPPSSILTLFSVSVMIVFFVTSEPVPAVVGIATR